MSSSKDMLVIISRREASYTSTACGGTIKNQDWWATKFSNFATFLYFRASARSYHISFHTVKYKAHVLSIQVFLSSENRVLKLATIY